MAVIEGGAKLEAYLGNLAKGLTNATEVKVGFPSGGETYPDGTPVAMVAALQNFGTGKIPPRPFFSTMVEAHKSEWGPQVGAQLAHNGGDARAALAVMGQVIEGELAESIVETNSPALSPITLMLRKMFGNDPSRITGAAVGEAARRVRAGESVSGASAKPLVWTGQMLGAIKSVVT